MPTDKKYHPDGPSAADKALERFTELMIEKIETLQGDWKKPWFTPGATQPPRNLSGRHYNGGNFLMLMMQAEKMGYDIPVWGTFDRITGLNYVKDKDGNVLQAQDKNGNKLPMISVNKGEKSFPVFMTSFTVVNQKTKEKIPYEDFRLLPREEQAKYKVYPKTHVYNVFNVAAQTNIEFTRPDLYEQIKQLSSAKIPFQQGELTSHPAIDKMIDDNLFFCPIRQQRGDQAYYSPSRDEIVVPTREQFVDGEAFATNTLHECAHATGAESRLNRDMKSPFGSPGYAKEELTAELSAAVIASQYGLSKHIKNDSAQYLKSWLGSLHQGPDFLKSVLSDVKRSTGMINQRIDAIQQEMDKGEKADFTIFRNANAPSQPDRNEVQAQAAKEVEQEEVVHHGRSR